VSTCPSCALRQPRVWAVPDDLPLGSWEESIILAIDRRQLAAPMKVLGSCGQLEDEVWHAHIFGSRAIAEANIPRKLSPFDDLRGYLFVVQPRYGGRVTW